MVRLRYCCGVFLELNHLQTARNAILAGGTPARTRYDLEFYNVGAASPFQLASLGKPSPDASESSRAVHERSHAPNDERSPEETRTTNVAVGC